MARPSTDRIAAALRSPVTFSVLAGLVIGALFLVGTGADPFAAYGAVVTGSLGADGIGATLSTGTSVLGMALALAIPLRAGLINLGGDGQMVLGGIAAAVTGLYSPLPAPLTVVLALLAGITAGAAYAALAALCENRFGVPLLVSSCCSATRRPRSPPIWCAIRSRSPEPACPRHGGSRTAWPCPPSARRP